MPLSNCILVRFLVRDDETQFEKARRLIRREVAGGRRIFVGQLVLLETAWVMRSRYDLEKAGIIEVVSELLDANDVPLDQQGYGCPALATSGA